MLPPSLRDPQDLERYDAWVSSHSAGSLWQSPAWRKFQEALGREVRVYVSWGEERILASSLVVIDRTTFGFSTWEVPRGPLFASSCSSDQRAEILQKLCEEARRAGALSVTLAPPNEEELPVGRLSSRSIGGSRFPEATIILDLTLTDQELLRGMHHKGRYNIRLAEKHGVRTEQSKDVAAFADLAWKTGREQGFRNPRPSQYRAFLEHLPGSFLLLAFAPHSMTPIAGLLGVVWNGMGIYYYGASCFEHRELMAPSLLQFQAMRHCRAQGARSYDLFGIAPPGAPPSHPWQGITDFKRKFGGSLRLFAPERRIVLRPALHHLLLLKRTIVG